LQNDALDLLHSGLDEGLDVPPAKGKAEGAKVIETAKAFKSILQSKGFTMDTIAEVRLTNYLAYQDKHRKGGIDLHDVNVFVAAFDRMFGLSIFQPEEIGWDQKFVTYQEPAPTPAPAPRQEPEPSYEELLRTVDLSSDSSAEMKAKLRRLANEQIVSQIGGSGLYGQWIASLESHPWNLTFTEEQLDRLDKAVNKLFRERNLPPVPKSFDYARRVLSKQGIVLPAGDDGEGMLTPDERLSRDIERQSGESLASFNGRRDFAQANARVKAFGEA